MSDGGVEQEYEALVARVQACRRCPRMEGRRRVLGPANGNPRAPVLILAEAPGRAGADRTGMPFSGDHSGRNFERLLAAAGWTRDDVLISNAVLCNPRKANGRNDRPTAAEIERCSEYCRALLALMRPQVVVTLGNVALAALARIAPHALRLREHVGRLWPWNSTYLFPLYHPSPQVVIAPTGRPLAQQEEDFRRLRIAVDLICAAEEACHGGALF